MKWKNHSNKLRKVSVMKKVRVGKIIKWVIIMLLAAVVLFTAVTFTIHKVKSAKELELLKEKGYYNPVSVGDYCLNVSKFGNENGKHTFVGMAGNGMGEFPVGMRKLTAPLEENDLVVFVERAGYGLSDDTENEMTLEYIVEDYRKALKNAGVEAPYILMPHSIGGAYATYWVSNYPDEIEAVVFLDGSQLSENAFDDREPHTVDLGDKALAFLAKMGFSRYVLRSECYLYPDIYSEEEQYLADALELMTLESTAPVSENSLMPKNAQDAFNGMIINDVPKLYICASWGFTSKEEITEYINWTNRQIEKNKLDVDRSITEIDDEMAAKMIAEVEQAREDTLYPYADKMGNCRIVCLGGDHAIYQQRPEECAEIISIFLNEIDCEEAAY